MPLKHDNGGFRELPDLAKLLKRDRDKIKQMMRRGGPSFPGRVIVLLVAVLAAMVAFYGFTFQVSPDELGVVTHFGKVDRQEPPGLHFRMPYPIDEVHLPKVTQRNIIEIGMRTGEAARVSYLRQEALALTGDENIVDINFVVFWHIKDAQLFLFNIKNPETTVKEVAESAMREVVGQSNIAPILTEARQKLEQAVKTLMQDVLDHYSAGVRIDQIELQKVDPPAEVIGAFRDVQAAATDKERLQNEAFAYANSIIPQARGDAERILQTAKGYQQQTIAEATGQAARFLKVYEEYRKAPEVTRKRLYLETMERLLSGTEKIILDTRQGVVPFLSLSHRHKPTEGGN